MIGRGLGVEGPRRAEDLALAYLPVGSIVRKHVAGLSSLGQEVSAALNAGQLLSGHLVRQMITAELAVPTAPARWLLESFPRTTDDAQWLTAFLQAQGTPVTAALVSDTSSTPAADVAGLIAFYRDLAIPVEDFFT